jgi:hypothetical protein
MGKKAEALNKVMMKDWHGRQILKLPNSLTMANARPVPRVSGCQN